MPLLLLLLIVVVIWMAVTFRSRMRVKDCIWRENRRRDQGGARYYLCVNCGAERWEWDGPPRICHRPADQE